MKTQDLKELNAEELKNTFGGGGDDGTMPPPEGSDGSGPQPGYDGITKGTEYGGDPVPWKVMHNP